MRRHLAVAGAFLVPLGLVVGLLNAGTSASSQTTGEPWDLELDVVTSAEEVLSGSSITYTITITNDGLTASAPFTVVNELPEETAFRSCTATGGGVCRGSGIRRSIEFDTLAAESSATVTLVADVRCAVADDTEIVNSTDLLASLPDPDADEVENEIAFVTVRNPPPAVVGLRADPSVLWPPNHKWASVTANYTVVDNCGPVATRVDVASNEPVDGTGDGRTGPDWQVLDDHRLRLRAERAGNGSGRVYTIAVTATDSAGQRGRATTEVRVPHSSKG